VLIGLAAINDAILLHVKIADWNLLWYAGIFGVVYSGGKSMIPKAAAEPKSARNLFAEIDQAMAEVADHTHYYPETWKGRGWEQATYKAFSSMFMYKARLFAKELVSLVLAPYILCISLAKCAEPICEFVVATKTEILGAGDVCGYATFDFDKFCDETWDGRTIGGDLMAGSLAESILQTGNVDEAMRHFPKPKARLGKMEKSFFSFKVRFTDYIWRSRSCISHLWLVYDSRMHILVGNARRLVRPLLTGLSKIYGRKWRL
jgi:autophagy-related protein 9